MIDEMQDENPERKFWSERDFQTWSETLDLGEDQTRPMIVISPIRRAEAQDVALGVAVHNIPNEETAAEMLVQMIFDHITAETSLGNRAAAMLGGMLVKAGLAMSPSISQAFRVDPPMETPPSGEAKH